MKVVKTDIVSSLATFFDRMCWEHLSDDIPDSAECRIEVNYPNGTSLCTSVGALRKARRAYFTIAEIWKEERNLREIVREEVYTILGEFSQTLKGESND